jgi:hypothetical protein
MRGILNDDAAAPPSSLLHGGKRILPADVPCSLVCHDGCRSTGEMVCQYFRHLRDRIILVQHRTYRYLVTLAAFTIERTSQKLLQFHLPCSSVQRRFYRSAKVSTTPKPAHKKGPHVVRASPEKLDSVWKELFLRDSPAEQDAAKAKYHQRCGPVAPC